MSATTSTEAEKARRTSWFIVLLLQPTYSIFFIRCADHCTGKLDVSQLPIQTDQLFAKYNINRVNSKANEQRKTRVSKYINKTHAIKNKKVKIFISGLWKELARFCSKQTIVSIQINSRHKDYRHWSVDSLLICGKKFFFDKQNKLS